ncbi:MAG TPA: fumarylacetoacetate hydrolase family protein [Acidimicrobiia bacterium]|nr:fumarylacetoacetate hydrolase family protein [Acidimicrobiia bacterium]
MENIIHRPAELLEFHTSMMPMFPGDIILTGTPGADVINPGDIAEAGVDGFAPLVVDVVRVPT